MKKSLKDASLASLGLVVLNALRCVRLSDGALVYFLEFLVGNEPRIKESTAYFLPSGP